MSLCVNSWRVLRDRWRCPTKLRGWRRWLAMCRPWLVANKTLVILCHFYASFYWFRFWLRSRFGSSGSSDIWLMFFFPACSPILSQAVGSTPDLEEQRIFRWNDVDSPVALVGNVGSQDLAQRAWPQDNCGTGCGCQPLNSCRVRVKALVKIFSYRTDRKSVV